jgi:hypothetical protein
MNKAVDRYMATLDKLLNDYAFYGIQALATVPDFLVQTAKLPEPCFNVVFRQSGELHSYYGPYRSHALWLVANAGGK